MSDEEDPGSIDETADELPTGPLVPVWRRVETIREFRETHGDRYVTVLEAITAAVLVGGYVYWAFLFLTQ